MLTLFCQATTVWQNFYFMDYQKILEDIYQEILPYAEKGKQADYIPALAKVNPDQFGICLQTVSGVIREIGGFNPMFFHYAEDINYLHRLHYHHRGVYFVPQAKAYHDRANIAPKPLNEQYMYQQMVLRMININDSWCIANARKWRFVLSILRAAIRKRQFSYLPMLSNALKRIGRITQEAKTNRYTQQQIASHWI